MAPMFRISLKLEASYFVRCLLNVPLQNKLTKAIVSESIAYSAKLVVLGNLSLFYTYLCFLLNNSSKTYIYKYTLAADGIVWTDVCLIYF